MRKRGSKLDAENVIRHITKNNPLQRILLLEFLHATWWRGFTTGSVLVAVMGGLIWFGCTR